MPSDCPTCHGNPDNETMTVEHITDIDNGRIFTGTNCHGQQSKWLFDHKEKVSRLIKDDE